VTAEAETRRTPALPPPGPYPAAASPPLGKGRRASGTA